MAEMRPTGTAHLHSMACSQHTNGGGGGHGTMSSNAFLGEYHLGTRKGSLGVFLWAGANINPEALFFQSHGNRMHEGTKRV